MTCALPSSMKTSKDMPPRAVPQAVENAEPRAWSPLVLVFSIVALEIFAGGIFSYRNYQRLNVGLVYPERSSGVLSEAARRAAQEALSSRQVVMAGLHRETEDGREAWVHVVKTPVRDGRGEITGVCGIFWDITVRKLAEEQIQRQLDELRRWQAVMLWREDRNMKTKREVNELLRRLGEPIRYPSVAEGQGVAADRLPAAAGSILPPGATPTI